MKEETMIKAREWSMRVMYILIAAALAISVMITAAPAQRVSASPGLAEWSRVSTPTTEDWVLAPESTIIDYALASDGEVAYAIVDKVEGSYHLLKSTDGTATWQDIATALEAELHEGEYIDELLRVACDTADPDFVTVALQVYDGISAFGVHVCISDDGGASFRDADEVEAGGVYLNLTSDLTVSPEGTDGMRHIAISGYGSDGDSAVFRCRAIGDIATAWDDAADTVDYPGWEDQGDAAPFTSVLVTDIIFSPDWENDRTILAVTVTGTGPYTVHLQTGTLGEVNGAWNKAAGLVSAVPVESGANLPMWLETWDARAIAGVALPSDYSSTSTDTRYAWVWVNYIDPAHLSGPNVGEIFRVKNALHTSVNEQIEGMPWLTNVSYWGTIAEGKAIAGVLADSDDEPLYPDDLMKECCEGVQVYRNAGITNMEICCFDWRKACKPPTGMTAMAVSYVGEDKVYAVAVQGFEAYDEGAWSVSFDDGDVWNQLSLIDTHIYYLSDVAVSPDCDKTMLVSVNLDHGCGYDSVWIYAGEFPEAGYGEYSGHWLRTWCGQLENSYGLLRLAPEETHGESVYLVDAGTSTLYWNDMATLSCWETKRAIRIDCIVDLAVRNESTIYVLDPAGNVTMSDHHGSAITWTRPVPSQVDESWTMTVNGDHILVGGQNGEVSHSDDCGETFAELGKIAADGYVTVAFDTYFDQNGIVYAALAGAGTDNGVYRWVTGQSTEWEDLGAEPYDYTGLALDGPWVNPMTNPDTGGVLYASYINGDTTGVARCLTPATDTCCGGIDWDYLTAGLTSELFYRMPGALKICGGLTPDSNTELLAIDCSEPYDMENGEAGTVWSFEDCYAKTSLAPTSPADGATISADPRRCVNVPFTIKWERHSDASPYDIQIARDAEFTDVVVDLQGYEPPAGKGARYALGKGTLSCGVTYYWRVRFVALNMGQAIHSWWSEPRSFTVVQRRG